jgi:hypothetical protein
MNTDDPNDLIDLLQNSAQVFIYSLEDMTKVKLSHKWLDIRCGKKRSRFQIKGSKKDFLPLKEIAKAYCDAVARRVNPLTVLGRPTPPRQPVSRP